MIDLHHDCTNPDSYNLVPRIGGGRVWLEFCPECGPHVGDQVRSVHGQLAIVQHVQPGGPWPNWTPGLSVFVEPFTQTFFYSYEFALIKRREELVAERLIG